MEYCSSGSLLSVLESPRTPFRLPEDEFLVVLRCVGELPPLPSPAPDPALSGSRVPEEGRFWKKHPDTRQSTGI